MADNMRTSILLERIGRVLHSETHAEGLKPTQWEVLRFLKRANRFSRSPGAVTAYLGMTKGTVSQTLSALERKGMIVKSSVATDRRNVALDLSARGRAILKKDPLNELIRAMGKLPTTSLAAMTEGLDQLLAETLRLRGGRPFGTCKTCRYFQRDAADGKPHLCGLLEESLSRQDSERICIEQEAV